MYFEYQLQIFKKVFLNYFRTLGLERNYGVLDLTLRQLSYRKTALLITIVQGCTASSLDTLAAINLLKFNEKPEDLNHFVEATTMVYSR
jgi:hypothetical protein